MATDTQTDYARLIHLDASPETVFDALTTVSGLAGWWAPVTGSGAEGGELRFSFGGDTSLVVDVGTARRPSAVIWNVRACAFLPEWVGTTPSFTLSRSATGGCELRFRHEGMRPQLECWDQCSAGWDQFLPSLRDYAETGRSAAIRLEPNG